MTNAQNGSPAPSLSASGPAPAWTAYVLPSWCKAVPALTAGGLPAHFTFAYDAGTFLFFQFPKLSNVREKIADSSSFLNGDE